MVSFRLWTTAVGLLGFVGSSVVFSTGSLRGRRVQKDIHAIPVSSTTSKGSIANRLFIGGQEVALKGTSWFGFETPDFVVNGLWQHSIDEYMAILKRDQFNVLRVPFSAEWIHYQFDIVPSQGILTADPSLQGKRSIEILDLLFQKCQEAGIFILLDLHRLHKEYISELWYSPSDGMYPSEVFFDTWTRILDRYANQSNLLGIDVLNEPHGRASWNNGDPSTDWGLFLKDAVPRINSRYPQNQWLYFMEGVQWGHDFQGYPGSASLFPAEVIPRIVFSPHVYGHSVVPNTPDDPYSLHNLWDKSYGFLWHQYPDQVVIPGEWGGRVNLDADWMNHFIDYLHSHNTVHSIFWSLGPNSGDVAGYLLDDWTTVDGFKQQVITRLVPSPSVFVFLP